MCCVCAFVPVCVWQLFDMENHRKQLDCLAIVDYTTHEVQRDFDCLCLQPLFGLMDEFEGRGGHMV